MLDQWLEKHQDEIEEMYLAARLEQGDTRPPEAIRGLARKFVQLLCGGLRGELNWAQTLTDMTPQMLKTGGTYASAGAESMRLTFTICRSLLEREKPKQHLEWLGLLGEYSLEGSRAIALGLEESLESMVDSRTREAMMFRSLVDNASDFILVGDNTTKLTYANPAAYKLLGYDHESQELIGALGSDLWPPEDRQLLYEVVLPNVLEKGSWTGDVRHLRKDGSCFETNSTAFVMFDDKGQPMSLGVMGRDITERKQSEKALLESEDKFRRIFEALPMGLYIYHLEDNDRLIFKGANPAADQLVGIDHSGLMGMTIEEAFPPLAETEIPDRYRRAARLGESWSTSQMFYQDERLSGAFEVYVFQSAPNTAVVAFLNVTERVRASEELRQEKQFSDDIINSLPGVFYLFGQDGAFARWNKKFAEVTGYTDEELTRMQAPDFFEGEDKLRVATAMQKVFEEGSTEVEADFVTRTGDRIPYFFTGWRKDVGGKPYLIGLGMDVTERKQADELTRIQRDMGVMLSTATQLEETMQRSLDMAVRGAGMDCGGAYIIDPENGALVMLGHQGLSADFAEQVAYFDASSPNTQIVVAGNPVYTSYPEIMKGGVEARSRQDDLKGFAIVPIAHQGKVVGSLNIASYTLDEVPLFARAALEAMALQIGSVIGRIRAEEEQKRLQEEVIDAQRRSLQELSTPIIPIMDRIIVMPLIGSIDTMRSKDITRALLRGITEYRAKIVILDVTGVPIVDSGVAGHLDKTVQAARLKGARTIVTGISDAVAEAIIDLGIDWSAIETLRDLQTGLIAALDNLGVRLTQ